MSLDELDSCDVEVLDLTPGKVAECIVLRRKCQQRFVAIRAGILAMVVLGAFFAWLLSY